MTGLTSDESHGRLPRQLLWLWVFVVVLYFAWEAAAYRGLFAMLAEWQFDRLGQDLPTFDFVLLTMLFGWPVLTVLNRRRSRQMRHEDETAALQGPSADAAEEDPAATASLADHQRHRERRLALLAARDYMHFLYSFAAALVTAAALSLLWTLALPNTTADPRVYTPDSLADQRPREGAAILRGTLRYGRISSFGRGILFARRTALYAPLFPPARTEGQIHYFVEFLPAERPDIHSGGIITHRDGILVRADLPGALIRLYRYLGYHPAPDYYVLYVSLETMRWPFYIIAAQFLIGGLVFFASALWQRHHLRRLTREVARQIGIEGRADGAAPPVPRT